MNSGRYYDAIVIGAGPSGSMAAWELARAGKSVALLERRILPRRKTCGGGIPISAQNLLELELCQDISQESIVESTVRSIRHTYQFKSPYLAEINPDGAAPEYSLWMVQRSIFDNALAQRAARAGVELIDGLPVKTVSILPDGKVLVQAEGEEGIWEASCGTLIGGDGANGVTAGKVKLRRNRALAIAIEAEVPHRWGDGHPDLRPDVCHLEYGVKRGYAWVFPKANHLNVGAGFFQVNREKDSHQESVKQDLRNFIVQYLSYLGAPQNEQDLTFFAHPLPIWNGIEPLQNQQHNVLLIGDAAGLINPFFGDGILHAMKSGKIAAQCVLQNRTEFYTGEIEKEFRTNFDAALKFSKFFYRFPWLCYRYGVINPNSTRTAVRLLSGDLTFPQISKRIMNRIRQAIAAERRGSFKNSEQNINS